MIELPGASIHIPHHSSTGASRSTQYCVVLCALAVAAAVLAAWYRSRAMACLACLRARDPGLLGFFGPPAQPTFDAHGPLGASGRREGIWSLGPWSWHPCQPWHEHGPEWCCGPASPGSPGSFDTRPPRPHLPADRPLLALLALLHACTYCPDRTRPSTSTTWTYIVDETELRVNKKEQRKK